jgi:hypothetical protein
MSPKENIIRKRTNNILITLSTKEASLKDWGVVERLLESEVIRGAKEEVVGGGLFVMFIIRRLFCYTTTIINE